MELSRTICVALVLAFATFLGHAGANFYSDFDIEWEPQNCRISDDGNSLSLSLVSNSSGSMVRTKKRFIYGSVSIMIQLFPGNSAGTVTTFYLSSLGDKQDEIDFEFLGNETGQPYTFHTNLYVGGVGKGEVGFRPWFDPTAAFHNFTIFWNPCMIVWFVDQIPIRVFRKKGVGRLHFPTRHPMYAISSIWAAEGWATQKGRVKSDWTKAPFVAKYRDIDLKICECYGGSCVTQCGSSYNWYASPDLCELSDAQLEQMQQVQNDYLIYGQHDHNRQFNKQIPQNSSYKQIPHNNCSYSQISSRLLLAGGMVLVYLYILNETFNMG